MYSFTVNASEQQVITTDKMKKKIQWQDVASMDINQEIFSVIAIVQFIVKIN